MTPLETVKAYYKLFERASQEEVDRLVADDFVLDDNPIDWHVRGKAQLWSVVNRPRPEPSTSGEEGSFVVHDYVGDDRRGAALWRWHVTGRTAALFGLPPTDKTADLDGLALVEFRDGKLSKLTEYWDAASLLRQLGVPVPAGRFPSSEG